MTDMTSLTLPPTIPTPPLTAWQERQRAARDERERVRADRIRHARQLEQAARESLARPAKAPTTPAEPKPRPTPAKPAQQRERRALYVCEGTCGRMTRPKGSQPHPDHPDAIPRRHSGKCSTCLTGGRRAPVVAAGPVRPCVTCGTPTRTKRTNPTLAPGATVRDRSGRCETCTATNTAPPVLPRVNVPTEALIAGYKAGESTITLGERYGVSANTVTRRLTAAGVTLRPPGNIGRKGRRAA